MKVVGSLAAIVAVGAAAFAAVWFGLKLLPALLPQATAAPTSSPGIVPVALSQIEYGVCRQAGNDARKAERARAHRNTRLSALGLGQLTEELAELSGYVGCLAETRPSHLCVAKDRDEFVRAIDRFLVAHVSTVKVIGMDETEFRQHFEMLRGDHHMSADYVRGGLAEVDSRVAGIHAATGSKLREALAAGFFDIAAITGRGEAARQAFTSLIGSTAVAPRACP